MIARNSAEIRRNVTRVIYPAAMPSESTDLKPRERQVLDFETSWWLYPQPKDQAIPEYLGMSATRYYQILRRLVDDEAAEGYAPLTVRRLRKMRRSRLERFVAEAGDGDGAG
jgi:hypothetical protein